MVTHHMYNAIFSMVYYLQFNNTIIIYKVLKQIILQDE